METLKSITGSNWGIVRYIESNGWKHIFCDFEENKGLPELGNEISWDNKDIEPCGDPKEIKSIFKHIDRFGAYCAPYVSGQLAHEWYKKDKDSEGLVYSFKKNGNVIEVIVCK
jgi:hypothetical protein